MRSPIGVFLAFVAIVSAPAARAGPVDDIARDYVELALSAHLLNNDGVEVDARIAPQLAAARSARRDPPRIGQEAHALISRLDALAPERDPLLDRRRRALRVRLTSLEFRSGAGGQRPSVEEEVRRRFGFTPAFPILSDYDPALAQLEAAMPGSGTLAERIDAMRKSATVPPDRIEPVFRAALAECRRRTAQHIALPPAETAEVQFVDDALTPASASYAGGGRTVIRISRNMAADVDRLLQHACHEGYPGHHAHFLAMDDRLFRERGWLEYGVGIDSDSIIPGAEAVAEHGVGLAFPVEERIAFERDVLFPLADLRMTNADQWRAYLTARPLLLGATATIVRDLLSGAIDDAAAQQALIRYRLQTPQASAQTVRMIRAFGSYLIASDFGWHAVDQAMRGRSPDEQWRLLHRLQSEPMLLDDILRL